MTGRLGRLLGRDRRRAACSPLSAPDDTDALPERVPLAALTGPPAFRAASSPARPEAAPEPACSPPRDLTADLTDLPVFREAVRRMTLDHARRCRCGDDIPGRRWVDRIVAAGDHLLGGAA